jgi:hypothetical protein
VTAHTLYEQMVSRRRELTPEESTVLAVHLDECPACRAASRAWEQQDMILRSSSPAWGAGSVRDRVLAHIDGTARAPRPTWDRPKLPMSRARSAWPGRGMALKLSAVFLLLSAVLVNSPLDGSTVGAARSPFHNVPWTSCTAEGYALLNYQQILPSAAAYRSPGVVFLGSTLRQVIKTLVNPVYYVFPRSPRNPIACQPNPSVMDVLVAMNPRDGTELHAIGVTEAATP